MTAAPMTSAAASRPLLSPTALRWLVLGLIVAVWEIAPRLGLVPPVLVATPSAALMAGWAERSQFASALMFTLGEIGLGLVIAYGLGGILGLLLGSVTSLRLTVLPLFASIYAVPFVVIYPLLTAWIGIGPASKVIFGGLYGLFPMLLATAAGVQTVDKALVTAARAMGANRRQILFEVFLPAAFPALLSGLRIGGALVAIGVVVAEMLAATEGIGFLITQNRTMFRTPEVYFGIMLVVLIAGFLDYLIGRLERRFTAWSPRGVTAR